VKSDKLTDQKRVLGFIAGLDLVSSMEYLPLSICGIESPEEYTEFVHDYVAEELEQILETISCLDPVVYVDLAEHIKQRDTDTVKLPIRIHVTLGVKTTTGEDYDEIHEIITCWDGVANTYVISGYYIDYCSLITMATCEYLNPERTENPVLLC
jgi:hypothetical protein